MPKSAVQLGLVVLPVFIFAFFLNPRRNSEELWTAATWNIKRRLHCLIQYCIKRSGIAMHCKRYPERVIIIIIISRSKLGIEYMDTLITTLYRYIQNYLYCLQEKANPHQEGGKTEAVHPDAAHGWVRAGKKKQ